jgi:hypothetical protein
VIADDLVALGQIAGPLVEPERERFVQPGAHGLRQAVVRGVPDQ